MHWIFLKIDIEGDEYHIFTKENLDFLNNNTGIIHCEFHLQIGGGPNKEANLKERFRYFRDNILPQINKEFEVLAVCGTNVTWDLYNEHFMEYYDCVVFVLTISRLFPEIMIKVEKFFEYFNNMPFWYQALFIGVVSAIYGLKGADIIKRK